MKIRSEHGTVVAWRHGCHQIVDDGAVLIDGSSIVAVGARAEILSGEASQADQVIDASGRLVIPDLNAWNMLDKSFVYGGGGECAGSVLGAMAPIVLTSRADSLEARVASVALASLAARH